MARFHRERDAGVASGRGGGAAITTWASAPAMREKFKQRSDVIGSESSSRQFYEFATAPRFRTSGREDPEPNNRTQLQRPPRDRKAPQLPIAARTHRAGTPQKQPREHHSHAVAALSRGSFLNTFAFVAGMSPWAAGHVANLPQIPHWRKVAILREMATDHPVATCGSAVAS